jgi:hypothetical protein
MRPRTESRETRDANETSFGAKSKPFAAAEHSCFLVFSKRRIVPSVLISEEDQPAPSVSDGLPQRQRSEVGDRAQQGAVEFGHVVRTRRLATNVR